MGIVDRKQELFENVVRLRRASRELPGDNDLMTVRAALERQLGQTVSRRLAARVLGVSHQALERWIAAGEVPVVYSSQGRLEVPVPALLSLYEDVEANRETHPGRYALKPVLQRQRKAAGRLRLRERAPAGAPARDPHDRARARSLAYHRAVARGLRRPMVQEARHVLFRWRQQGQIDPRYAEQWEELLERSIPEIRKALVAETQEADDLRQNSPFAGLLSEAERARIVAEVR